MNLTQFSFKHPPYLKQGDLIGITCPSGFVDETVISQAEKVLQSWGFRVRKGVTAGSRHHYFSAPDEVRRNDLQQMLDDAGTAAILMGRGGYGMSRIIDGLDLERFSRYPKWICGFSDITLLHTHIHRQLGIASVHSPMCGAFTGEAEQPPHIICLKELLSGGTPAYTAPASRIDRAGSATGILTGGNLAMLAHSAGTASQADTSGKILFLEDVGEYLYNIDRMLYQIRRAGMLENLQGVIIGGFTDMKDTERPFGDSISGIISAIFEPYGYPVCGDFPAGHIERNYPLCLGMPHRLTVTGSGSTLQLLRSTNT